MLAWDAGLFFPGAAQNPFHNEVLQVAESTRSQICGRAAQKQMFVGRWTVADFAQDSHAHSSIWKSASVKSNSVLSLSIERNS